MVRDVLRSSRPRVPPLLTLFQDNNQLTINLSGGRRFYFLELAESGFKNIFKSFSNLKRQPRAIRSRIEMVKSRLSPGRGESFEKFAGKKTKRESAVRERLPTLGGKNPKEE